MSQHINQKELTRDCDIYNDAMQTRVVNNSDFSSEISDIRHIEYRIDYACDMWWSNLNREHIFENVSINRLVELTDMSEIELAEEAGKTGGHVWRAEGTTIIELEIYYDVKLPDGEEVGLKTDFRLEKSEGYDKASGLIQLYDSKKNINIQIDGDNYTINSDFGTYSATSEALPRFRNDEEVVGQITEYLKKGNYYARAKVGKPRHSKNTIIIPVVVDDNEYQFEFENPKNNEEFWEFVECIGNGDPMLVENKEVYITFNNDSTVEYLATNGLWSVLDEKPKLSETSRTLIDELKSIFTF